MNTKKIELISQGKKWSGFYVPDQEDPGYQKWEDRIVSQLSKMEVIKEFGQKIILFLIVHVHDLFSTCFLTLNFKLK